MFAPLFNDGMQGWVYSKIPYKCRKWNIVQDPENLIFLLYYFFKSLYEHKNRFGQCLVLWCDVARQQKTGKKSKETHSFFWPSDPTLLVMERPPWVDSCWVDDGKACKCSIISVEWSQTHGLSLLENLCKLGGTEKREWVGWIHILDRSLNIIWRVYPTWQLMVTSLHIDGSCAIMVATWKPLWTAQCDGLAMRLIRLFPFRFFNPLYG